MKDFGIHSIKNPQTTSYFVVRPFGNYLIFADDISDINKDLFKSFGGLSKMFFESRSNINTIHQRIFSTFGTSAVADFISEESNTLLPLQRWNYEHVDPAFNWFNHGQKQCLTFKQKDIVVSIMGKELILTEDGILYHNEEISDQMLSYFKEQKTQIVYATNFISNSCLILK